MTRSKDGSTLLERVLRDVLLREDVELLWTAWFDSEELPWQSFLRAGIRAMRVAEWVVARGEEGLEDRRVDHPVVNSLLPASQSVVSSGTRDGP